MFSVLRSFSSYSLRLEFTKKTNLSGAKNDYFTCGVVIVPTANKRLAFSLHPSLSRSSKQILYRSLQRSLYWSLH